MKKLAVIFAAALLSVIVCDLAVYYAITQRILSPLAPGLKCIQRLLQRCVADAVNHTLQPIAIG